MYPDGAVFLSRAMLCAGWRRQGHQGQPSAGPFAAHCARSRCVPADMSLLRAARSLGALPWARASGSVGSAWQPAAAFSSAQAAPADNPFYAVPEGHQHSDLSDSACNIGGFPPACAALGPCRGSV